MARRRDVRPVPAGWRPLGAGQSPVTSPFAWLARAHGLSAAGDALVAVSLAGSLFFSISPEAARGKVTLYLALTMAPFAVVAPLVGPIVERRRGGRRGVVVGSTLLRAVLCVLMVRHRDGLLLFPEAFAVLVLGKAYGVVRAAFVPVLVDDPRDLVQANAKLSLLSGAAAFAAGGPGVALLQLGPGWVLALATTVYASAAVVALSLPPGQVAQPSRPEERAELHGAGIVLAAAAMAILRGAVGFLAFFLAFSLRADDAPTWWFGLVLAASGVGALAGAGMAPALRPWASEERILLGSLLAVTAAGLVALQIEGRVAGMVLAFGVGSAAAAARLCFDAIVQRDAPDADQARAFARFETRFQLAWVAGALVPVVVSLPDEVGYGVVTIASSVAAASYLTGRRPWVRWLAELRRRLARSTR